MLTAKEVKDFAREQGVDLVGIASAKDFPESFPPRPPERLLPQAQSVVVFGLPMLLGSTSSPSFIIKNAHTMGLYDELNRVNYQIGRFLEGAGYRAVTVSSHPIVEMSEESRGMVGDLSLKHAALAAGLGVWSLPRLVLTTRWGPRVRFSALVTDAPLEPDSPLKEELCDNCSLCMDVCPVGAIEPDKLDTGKCLRESVKYGLVAVIRFLNKLVTQTPEEQQQAFRDPQFWNLWQATSFGLDYHCFECLNVCPVGQ